MKVRIASRGSALALWQARFVAQHLEARGVNTELVIVETQGDKSLLPFAALSGQGFFTKAVQEAVLQGQADLAVHSFKDLPSAQIPNLQIAAITEREDSRDVLLALPRALDATCPLGLKAGAVVGTSAVRRKAQLNFLDSALVVRELRGNVPTRVEKLRRAEFDAIVLASAGLKRLGLVLDDLEVRVFAPDFFVPAPAQGALAVECRADDLSVLRVAQTLDSAATRVLVSLERGLMARFQGGCQLALGAYAKPISHDLFELTAWYGGRVFQERGLREKIIDLVFEQIAAYHPEVRL
jgi:hydroxymethylbilane synthase